MLDNLGNVLAAMVLVIALGCGCWGIAAERRARRALKRRAEAFFGAVDRAGLPRLSARDRVNFEAAMAELHRDLERGDIP